MVQAGALEGGREEEGDPSFLVFLKIRSVLLELLAFLLYRSLSIDKNRLKAKIYLQKVLS